jgi:hypothetical protein
MKTEVNVALIGGGFLIVATILAGVFGLLGRGKADQPLPKTAPAPQSQSSPSQSGDNHIDNVSAGGNVNIEQTSTGK